MTSGSTLTVRVTGVRSGNTRGYGGAIFTGVPVDSKGSVVDAGSYVVVKASGSVLGFTTIEKGQWWSVAGDVIERSATVDGFHLIEKQVNADTAVLARPSGEQIIHYIANNPAFEGFGVVKARRLWDSFGVRLYDILDSGDTEILTTVLAGAAAQKLVEAWSIHGQSRTLQWLQSHGFDAKVGRKVLGFFGDEAQSRIEEDPYRLLSFMGKWSAVDRLAIEQFGMRVDDPRRLRGAIEEACYRVFRNGHTAMVSADLMDHVKPLLGAPPAGIRWIDLLSAAVNAGLSNGSFVRAQHGLQPLGALIMERQVAATIQSRIQSSEPQLMRTAHVDEIVEAVHAEDGIELNLEQRAALHLANQHPFLCITGGAGVGKTTVLKTLYRLYKAVGVRVVQVALAGRAAKRMQEATGEAASTIASFLKNLRENSFEGSTVLVIDEASMVDIISMSNICNVLPDHVRLVLVGDPHQLMPVGPGLVLHCIQKVPGVPFVELKTVKRYGGAIAALAAAVRAGQWPVIGNDESAAVSFIPCEKQLIADVVVDLYALDPTDTQILAPLRGGPAGTKLLNQLCQDRFTKNRTEVVVWNVEFERNVRCGFKESDIVLCTKNLWDKGLQNGSLGRVVDVEGGNSEHHVEDEIKILAWVEWDDGIRRALTEDMLDDIELGYAVTVHKAQGSQWKRVIIPVTDSKLLDRTLLYTAITRAQTQVILVGDEDAARVAVIAAPHAANRNVALDLNLKSYLGNTSQVLA